MRVPSVDTKFFLVPPTILLLGLVMLKCIPVIAQTQPERFCLVDRSLAVSLVSSGAVAQSDSNPKSDLFKPISAFGGNTDIPLQGRQALFCPRPCENVFRPQKTASNRARWTSTRPPEPIFA